MLRMSWHQLVAITIWRMASGKSPSLLPKRNSLAENRTGYDFHPGLFWTSRHCSTCFRLSKQSNGRRSRTAPMMNLEPTSLSSGPIRVVMSVSEFPLKLLNGLKSGVWQTSTKCVSSTSSVSKSGSRLRAAVHRDTVSLIRRCHSRTRFILVC